MADINIEDLTSNSLTATDYFHISKNGIDYKAFADNLLLTLPYSDTTATNLNELADSKSNLLPFPKNTINDNMQLYAIPGGWNTVEYGFTIGTAGYESTNGKITKNVWFFGNSPSAGDVRATIASTDGGNTYTKLYIHYAPQEAASVVNANMTKLFTHTTDTAWGGPGYFSAKICPDGYIIIDFGGYISTAGTVSNVYTSGFSVNNIKSYFPEKIRDSIVAIGAGNCYYINTDGTFNLSLQGYGGFMVALSDGTGWSLHRVYNTSGSIGAWAPTSLPTGLHISGTCYAKYHS